MLSTCYLEEIANRLGGGHDIDLMATIALTFNHISPDDGNNSIASIAIKKKSKSFDRKAII